MLLPPRKEYSCVLVLLVLMLLTHASYPCFLPPCFLPPCFLSSHLNPPPSPPQYHPTPPHTSKIPPASPVKCSLYLLLSSSTNAPPPTPAPINYI